MKVVIYAPPDGCSACRATKVNFDKLGIIYDVIETDDGTLADLRREGFSAFPVVKVDCGDGAAWSWSGFRFDDIKRLAQLFKG